ncbi:MAG TPA: cytochrome P450 [Pseudonocardiaceae bacterium]|nr:cytochrome P450 [Pseudonocardiaceae bacterium]
MTATHQDEFEALFDPANRARPYELYAALRERGPFTRLNGLIGVVADHETCAKVLRDPAMSSDRANSQLGRMRQVQADQGQGEVARSVSFLSMDPPDHTRLRRLVSKAFTAKVIAGMRPKIQDIVDELFAAFQADGQVDIVPRLAYPLPVRIITDMLGVPLEDHDRFEDWSRNLVRGLDPMISIGDPAILAEIDKASQDLAAYFVDLIAKRRNNLGDDLLSKLVLAEEEGDQLTEEELVATCILLLVAGHETTANLIANGVLALLRNPGQLAALRADPSLIDGTVDEILRYDPPVQLTTRVVMRDTTVGPVTVPEGGVLLMLLAAANRDPEAFPDPDRFDITRDARKHLSFAAGAHFCLGAPLARLEASVALTAFAQRLADPVLDEQSLRYRAHMNLRGPEQLIVRFG